MIESNNPEINVDELMKRVKAEAQFYCSKTNSSIGFEERKGYRISQISYEEGHFSGITSNLDVAEEHLNTADLFSQTPQKFPDKLDRFPFNLSRGLQKFLLKVYGFLFKKQRVVNASFSHSIRELIRFNQATTLELQQALSRQADQFGTLHDSNRSIRESNELTSETNQLILESQESARRSNQQLEAQLQSANLLITQLQQELHSVRDQFHSLQQEQASNNGQLQQELHSVRDQFHSLQQEQASNNSYTKIDLMLHKRLISHLIETACKLPDETAGSEENLPVQSENLLDSVYFKLEEQFRGSYDEIIQRLEPYIQIFENANIRSLDSYVLDLGCGRGEWLELLQQSGYSAKGLDTNILMVEKSQGRGLEVLHQDAIAYLSMLPDNHLAAVTGFHIIEHLQFPVLACLLGEVARVLKPGGLAIFETPNPQNVLVGTHNFYIDPTHLNPLPSLLSKFLLEQTGFANVEILNLHPYDDSYHLQDGGEVAERFNDYFYGPQDYAVIGHKL